MLENHWINMIKELELAFEVFVELFVEVRVLIFFIEHVVHYKHIVYIFYCKYDAIKNNRINLIKTD
jgi:hypothetical protein